MKTIKYLIVVFVLVFEGTILKGADPVKGTIQYRTNTNKDSITAEILIPMPQEGIPVQLKSVITKLRSMGNEKNEQRFLFMKNGETLRADRFFVVREGKINAIISNLKPFQENINVFLIYKGTDPQHGKPSFNQVKVELVQ